MPKDFVTHAALETSSNMRTKRLRTELAPSPFDLQGGELPYLSPRQGSCWEGSLKPQVLNPGQEEPGRWGWDFSALPLTQNI